MSQFKDIIKARFLRKRGTEVEKILWEELRNNNLGVKFRRQHPISNFVVDFYAPKHKLAIELDGSVHNSLDAKEYDEMRTKFLEKEGIILIRFWNNEIEQDLSNVLLKIKDKIINLETKAPRQ
jgi:very-short-patch-repair endonuclease